MENTAYIVLAMVAVLLLYYYAKAKCLFRAIIFSMASGGFSLAALWLAGHFISIGIAPAPFTAAVAAILGIPGVAGLLLLPMF